MNFWAAGILSFALLGHTTCSTAQIFGGVSSSGSVILSNIGSDDARTLVVSASFAAPGSVAAARVAKAEPAVVSLDRFQSFIFEASVASRLPAELIHAVIKTESNYNPRAQSPKGARGLMQLMPATAKRFGITDSLDPRDNILTGSRYLRWLMDYFNQDVELAVAAYNAGEGAVVRAGNRIPPFPETQKYVPKVLGYFRRASGVT